MKENQVIEKPKEVKNKNKLFIVENRTSQPFEFHLGTKYYRLEPRGKKGSKITLTQAQINHKDFVSCIKKITVKEI